MIKTHSIPLSTMREKSIFPSSYTSSSELNFSASGEEPERSFRFKAMPLSRPVTRRLDGDTVEALAELYGQAERLRFIGAFEVDGDADSPEPMAQDPTQGELVGLLTWRYDDWNETVWLCDIRVREQLRGNGIGSKLLEDLLWAAMRTEARGVMLETQTTNVGAIDFYLHHGFHLVGLNTAMYGDPESGRADVALYFWLGLS